ncbi:MAG: hypothetical protein IKA36_04100 [Clostridia bacterium]|nr:hypothetical protein [Clostridia bacterium]
MTYDELYNKYKELTSLVLGDITITDIEKEGLANVTLKPHQTFQKLNDIKEILNNRKEHLENTLSLIDELIEAGQPVKPLKKNPCVNSSYSERSSSCFKCARCVGMYLGDTDYLVCNICDQAKKAKVNNYRDRDIIEAFKVSEYGICKAYRKASGDRQDITSYTQEDWNREHPVTTPSEPLLEIPPEAPYGSVDEDHMEPEPNNP